MISVVNYVNDILSFMTCFHPYYIQERPVRSIIIIKLKLILLLLLFIIVTESLLFSVLIICVLFDWSV